MLEWWSEQPWWLRLGLAGGLMVAGVVVFLFVNLRLGLVMVGVGFVLFLMGGRSNAEKNGYRF